MSNYTVYKILIALPQSLQRCWVLNNRSSKKFNWSTAREFCLQAADDWRSLNLSRKWIIDFQCHDKRLRDRNISDWHHDERVPSELGAMHKLSLILDDLFNHLCCVIFILLMFVEGKLWIKTNPQHRVALVFHRNPRHKRRNLLFGREFVVHTVEVATTFLIEFIDNFHWKNL